MAKTAKAASTPENKDDDVFNYILDESVKTLHFPTSESVANEFKISVAMYFKVLERLVEAGKIEKIGRYHFKIAPAFLP